MFSRLCRSWSFHVVVLQGTAKKCTKNHNLHPQPFCALNLLFSDVAVAIAVVVSLSSIFTGDGSRTVKDGSWELKVQEVGEQGMGSVNLWVF